MEEKKETKELEWCEITTQKIEEQIKHINEEGIQPTNVKYLSELVDIHKDLANETYWKEKINMYRESGSYNEGYGRYRESGRYNEGSYGRRGVKGTGRGRYRGEEMMDEMMYHYGNYSEGGQYGAEGEAMEALSNLMESAYEYFKELKENANSPDEVKMMEHYFKKMGQM